MALHAPLILTVSDSVFSKFATYDNVILNFGNVIRDILFKYYLCSPGTYQMIAPTSTILILVKQFYETAASYSHLILSKLRRSLRSRRKRKRNVSGLNVKQFTPSITLCLSGTLCFCSLIDHGFRPMKS